MMLTLTRDTYLKDCTMGVLSIGTNKFQTMERPWIQSESCRGGAPCVSCVPEGTYQLVLHDTPKHPQTWALVNLDLDICHDPAPGKRSDVLIHPANYAIELEGCIAPGESRFSHGGEWTVVDSRRAFNMIKVLVPWTAGHELVISASPQAMRT